MAKSRYRKAYEGITGKKNDPYYSEARMKNPQAYRSSSKRKEDKPGLLRGELTPDELLKNAPAPGEGGTVRTTGPGVGKTARDRLAVGFAPDRGRAEEVEVTADEHPALQMQRFNQENREVLGTKGAEMAIGLYVEPTGRVVSDRTVLLPRTAEGFHTAMQTGVQSGQYSIGNLGKQKFEGEIVIPHYLQRDQYPGSMGRQPTVTDLGVQADTGRRRVRITPGLQEATEVEADAMLRAGVPTTDFEGNLVRTDKFPDITPTPKSAGQYVKESLGFTRKARKKSMYKGRPTTY